MMDRTLQSRPEAPSRRAFEDSPRRTEEAILRVQRSAGNRATAQLVQRWINGPAGRLDKAWFEDEDLDEWLEKQYTKWVRKKTIPEETKKAIKAKVKSWIEDDEEHSSVSGKRFTSYGAIFDMARRQVGPAAPEGAPVREVEMYDAAPLSPPSTPYEDVEDMEDPVIPSFRRASSVPREIGAPEFEAVGDEERVKRRERRGKDYREKAKPYYSVVPHHRRAQDKAGSVPEEAVEFRFGPLSFELQGGPSHRMTAKGGGSAPTYFEVLTSLRLAASPMKDTVIAGHLRDLLEKGTIPDVDKPVKLAMAEVLAVVVGPEMSRASFALGAFTAALHWVAEGKIGLLAAFVGGSAVYLGANEGGAAALRGTVEKLKKAQQKKAMSEQTERAEPVIKAWLIRWVDKDLEGEDVIKRYSEIHVQLSLNALRLVAELTPVAKVAEKDVVTV